MTNQGAKEDKQITIPEKVPTTPVRSNECPDSGILGTHGPFDHHIDEERIADARELTIIAARDHSERTEVEK